MNKYQNQLVIFSHGLNVQQTTKGLETQQINLKANESQQIQSLNQTDIKNRLYLFKYFYYLLKSTPVCTQLVHEKFTNITDMDSFCKRNSILNYIYLNNSDSQAISEIATIFQKYQQSNNESESKVSFSLNTSNDGDKDFNINNIELVIRSFGNAKGAAKYTDKKYNLNDFLFNFNKLLADNYTSFNALSTIITTNLSIASSSSASGQAASNLTTLQIIQQYLDLILNLTNTSIPIGLSYYPQQQNSSLQQQTQTILSQTNITILFENSRSSTPVALSSLASSSGMSASSLAGSSSSLNNINFNSRNSNLTLKKLESQIINRLMHILQLFSTRTRIEVIAVEIIDLILQQLANSVHLDCDEQHFDLQWKDFIDKLNPRSRKLITSLRLEEVLRDLRFRARSKIFIIYSLKSEHFKVFVVP